MKNKNDKNKKVVFSSLWTAFHLNWLVWWWLGIKLACMVVA